MTDSEKELSRREFVGAGLSAGWALAVLPVTGWAITTPQEGLIVDTVKIPTKGGPMPGYRAMPKGKGPFPVVLVVQEIFGIHAYIQDVCRRFAKEGYVAVAPSLYFREGDVTTMPDFNDILKNVVGKVPQEQVWSDLDATLASLKDVKAASPTKAGITGFCWGGNVVWSYAAHNPKLKAGVAWYGRVASTMGPGAPKAPVDLAADLKVPVLGLYGGKDGGIPQDTLEKMKAALAKGKSGSQIVVYPEAEHGFHADYRPSYHETSAKDGWQKTLAWFRDHDLK